MKLFACLLLVVFATASYLKRDWLFTQVDLTTHGPYTIQERVDEYGNKIAARLKPDFEKAGVAYPPQKITLVVLKQERTLELYAGDSAGDVHYIRSYPILAASGKIGPKLRKGDGQVPEGIYGVESLNPNSHYHLALHVDYPNAFDHKQGHLDGRNELGGDIMIHGSNVSIGCVALGDPAAEDIFILAARAGTKNIQLIFCPYDFRLTKGTPVGMEQPAWTGELYTLLKERLAALPLPPQNLKGTP